MIEIVIKVIAFMKNHSCVCFAHIPAMLQRLMRRSRSSPGMSRVTVRSQRSDGAESQDAPLGDQQVRRGTPSPAVRRPLVESHADDSLKQQVEASPSLSCTGGPRSPRTPTGRATPTRIRAKTVQPAVVRLLLQANPDMHCAGVADILAYPREVLQALPRPDIVMIVDRLVHMPHCRELPAACKLMGHILSRWQLDHAVIALARVVRQRAGMPPPTLPNADLWFHSWVVDTTAPDFALALDIAMQSQCASLVFGFLQRAFPSDGALQHFLELGDAFWMRRALCHNLVPPTTTRRTVSLVAAFLQGSELDSAKPDLLWAVAYGNCRASLGWLLETVPLGPAQVRDLLQHCCKHQRWALVRDILAWVKRWAHWFAERCKRLHTWPPPDSDGVDTPRRSPDVEVTGCLRMLVDQVADTEEGRKLCRELGLPCGSPRGTNLGA